MRNLSNRIYGDPLPVHPDRSSRYLMVELLSFVHFAMGGD